jgi:prepilin-type N-terminal cleavage/methylation domain-containing protein
MRTSMRPTNRQAFTLVEILVVLVILGIAAAVIMPQIGAQSDLKAAAAARLVMADLIYAQNRAIATQTKHYVFFDTTAGSYRIKMATATAGVFADVPQPITKDPFYEVKFGQKGTSLADIGLGTVSVEAQTAIAFDELGVPYAYDPVAKTITATSVTDGSVVELRSGAFSMKVYVQPYTGEITTNSPTKVP